MLFSAFLLASCDPQYGKCEREKLVTLDTLNKVGDILHGPEEDRLIREVSGMVTCAAISGGYWVHGDSGSGSYFYAVDSDNNIVVPPHQRSRYYTGNPQKGKEPYPGIIVRGVENVDWEAMARSPDGILYIADMGNNDNDRRNGCVIEIMEPDPREVMHVSPRRVLEVVYPDQKEFPPLEDWHFDCEAMFIDGRQYFITKHRSGRTKSGIPGAKLYRLDTDHTDRPNVLTLVGRTQTIRSATDASLSPDGNLLAVLSYRAIHFFARPKEGDDWFSRPAGIIHLPLKETGKPRLYFEAICWENDRTLRMATDEYEKEKHSEVYRVTIHKMSH